SRFNTATGSATVSACGTANATISLTVDSSYVCCLGCWKPISKTLYLNDGVGTRTLSWGGSNWGSAVFSYTMPVTTDCVHVANADTDIAYSFACAPGGVAGRFDLTEFYKVGCAPAPTCSFQAATGTIGGFFSTSIITNSCNDAETWTFN